MAGEWPTVVIGTVANIYDGPHATPPMSEEGPIFLGIDSLENGRLNIIGARHVSESVFRDWTRRVVPTGGDLVFSYETRLGQAALVPNGLRCCLGRRLALVRPKSDALNNRYFLYYFLSPVFQEHIRAHTKPGSTVDRIHLNDFPNFPVVLPPRRYQDEIAELLGSLDDKIELNRRMAVTLEAMARALFKSWFVDFDPVLAKAGGRPTGLPDDLAALFPDSFDANGLPKGWEKEEILGHARLLSGGTPKTGVAEYWDEHVAWASAADVSQSRDAFLIRTQRTITERGLNESATQIIPKLATVVVARGATTGRFCILGRDMAMNQTCYALVTARHRPFWLNCAFNEVVYDLLQAAHGSVFDTITTATLRSVHVMSGPDVLIDRFETIVAPLFARILQTIEEAATLADLRDTLLPKLISGELRIADAEAQVSAA